MACISSSAHSKCSQSGSRASITSSPHSTSKGVMGITDSRNQEIIGMHWPPQPLQQIAPPTTVPAATCWGWATCTSKKGASSPATWPIVENAQQRFPEGSSSLNCGLRIGRQASNSPWQHWNRLRPGVDCMIALGTPQACDRRAFKN
jgi:hypothetical protein